MISLNNCDCSNFKKNGHDRNSNQRFKCRDCGRTWIESRVKPIGDMRIDLSKAVLVINLLVEGMSVRAVERISGICRDTICDLILVVGENCGRLLSRMIRNVEVDDVQIDEIWSFVLCKERTRKRRDYSSEFGDCWTYIAIERNTKLVLAHHVAEDRQQENTDAFLKKLRRAITGRFQLSSDGFTGYQFAVPYTFRFDVDFGQLVKQYASQQEETRYSPAQIISAKRTARFGNPDRERICTSHVERLNLTLRMNLRRFTRLTNGHSKSLAHHAAMQNILFAWYNLSRKHSALEGKTPAMESGITDSVWTIERLLREAANHG